MQEKAGDNWVKSVKWKNKILLSIVENSIKFKEPYPTTLKREYTIVGNSWKNAL